MIDINVLPYILAFGGLISAVSAWVPMVRYFRDSKKDTETRALEQGKSIAEIQRLAKDVDEAHKFIKDIYSRLERNQDIITEMRSDLKHLVKAVDGICNNLDGGCK
jgi:hypothetical protein